MSLLERDRSATLVCSSVLTVANSSLTDCNSSLEVSSSSLVDCSSCVHGLHFLVGGLELFVGGLPFLVGGLQVFLLGPQFLLQRRIRARLHLWPRCNSFFARFQNGGLVLDRSGLSRRRVLENDQEQSGCNVPNPGPRAPVGPSD